MKSVIGWLKKQIRYYFGFSQTEANGVIVLAVLMIISILIPVSIKAYLQRKPLDPNYISRLDSLARQINSQIVPIDTGHAAEIIKSVELTLSYFNPNTINYDSLINFGLAEVVSRRIIKYRKMGGSFRKPEDLQKIYGLTSWEYQQLQPYIVLPEISQKNELQNFGKPDAQISEHSIPRFDINSVDSVKLKEIQGIGEVLSSRIVRFRNSLGGFYSIDQLDDIYGLEPYALENLKTSVYLSDNFQPEQMNINNVEIKTLVSHPYIDYNMAKVIVAYRDQHGNFSDIVELLKIYTIDSTWFERMKPYLEL